MKIEKDGKTHELPEAVALRFRDIIPQAEEWPGYAWLARGSNPGPQTVCPDGFTKPLLPQLVG